MGCHALLQGISPTQGSNSGLLNCRWILYCLSHQESPRLLEWVAIPSPGDLSDPGIDCCSSRVSHCGVFSHCRTRALGKSKWASVVRVHGLGWASLVTQLGNNLPPMQETWVRFLGWEDPLEEGMATHSSILSWRIPMDRGAWQAAVHGVTKSQT